jgi:hypothetical protein
MIKCLQNNLNINKKNKQVSLIKVLINFEIKYFVKVIINNEKLYVNF